MQTILNDQLSVDQRPDKPIKPGVIVVAKTHSRVGVSNIFVEPKTEGVLMYHYKSLHDRKERYGIFWSRQLNGSHLVEEIQVTRRKPKIAPEERP